MGAWLLAHWCFITATQLLMCHPSHTVSGARLPWMLTLQSHNTLWGHLWLWHPWLQGQPALSVSSCLWDTSLEARPRPPFLGDPSYLSGVLLRPWPLCTWWQCWLSSNLEQNQTLPLSAKPGLRITLGQNIENTGILFTPPSFHHWFPLRIAVLQMWENRLSGLSLCSRWVFSVDRCEHCIFGVWVWVKMMGRPKNLPPYSPFVLKQYTQWFHIFTSPATRFSSFSIFKRFQNA